MTLREFAAEGSEAYGASMFDAFGDDFEVEGVRERDGGVHGCGAAISAVDVADEGSVDP